MPDKLPIDTIGSWSEGKIEIVRKYAQSYSKIFSSEKQKQTGFSHFYIDAFASSGFHISRDTGSIVLGTPLKVLSIEPQYKHYFFIDIDGSKLEISKQAVGDRRDVTILRGNANETLVRNVFPKIEYKKYHRALCLLDPYKHNLKWQVIESAGASNAIDLLLNFPIMAINRDVLKRNTQEITRAAVQRMNDFWGDEDSWRVAAYKKEKTLFGDDEEKLTNKRIVKAFCDRIKQVAGFNYTAKPLPVKNTKGGVIYYILFASQKQKAVNIANDIFNDYRD